MGTRPNWELNYKHGVAPHKKRWSQNNLRADKYVPNGRLTSCVNFTLTHKSRPPILRPQKRELLSPNHFHLYTKALLSAIPITAAACLHGVQGDLATFKGYRQRPPGGLSRGVQNREDTIRKFISQIFMLSKIYKVNYHRWRLLT
jgi:hypothetical protein